MKLSALALVSLTTLLTQLQQTPAPVSAIFVAVYSGILGGSTGALINEVTKRDALAAAMQTINYRQRRANNNQDEDPLADLPQPAADECKSQLQGVTVKFSKVDGDGVQGGVRLDDVPPACMTLANVFLDQGQEAGQGPIPMGSANLEYHGLSDEQLRQLQAALEAQ